MAFARYMELALYHPEFGYYRTRDRFGTAGDFYTAEQLQPVFGELLASYVYRLSRLAGAPQSYSVLELGTGRGDMRHALAPWSYRAFDWNAQELPETWEGLVFANEFFDALPVHLLTRQAGKWKELFVTAESTGLRYSTLEPSSPVLLDYGRRYGQLLPEGGQIEVCPATDEWLARVAGFLSQGQLLVIDYGYSARELSRFPSGTLLAYQKHQTHIDPLREPGQRDITAHVNFSWLEDCASRHGLQLLRSESLAQWALSVWDQPQFERRWAEADARWRLQWKQIVFGLGETFRVLQFHRTPGAA